MKKRIISLVLAVVFILSIFTLTACVQGTGNNTVTVIVGEKKIEIKTDSNTLHELFLELLDTGKIANYEYGGEGATAYITKIDDLVGDWAKDQSYITIFHDIADPLYQSINISGKIITLEFFGKNMYCSSVGGGMLPIVDGATYYIFVTSKDYFA